MPLWKFVRDNARWLAAGLVLTLASSFGQTYFISLSGGHIRDAFGLSHGGWGGIYSVGTLLSAITLVLIGRLADRFKVRTLAMVTLPAFAVVCLAMSVVPNWITLILVIFGLRLCGQGMMSHLALTAMARWFRGNRGRAVAIASLGFSLGEAILPTIFVALTAVYSWRTAWVLAAGVLVLAVLPLLLSLLAEERSPQSMDDAQHSAGMSGRHWTRPEVIRHWLFWWLIPGTLAPSFIVTCLFFHQVHLTNVKGWSLAAYVGLYPLYSISSVISNFIAGSAVDRDGTMRLLPIYLLPISAALVIISYAEAFWWAALAFVLLGITQGASQSLNGSVWAEYFGTRHLGAIRSITVAVMVLASAVGPAVTGALMDVGLSFETQCLWMSAYVIVMSIVFWRVANAAQRALSRG